QDERRREEPVIAAQEDGDRVIAAVRRDDVGQPVSVQVDRKDLAGRAAAAEERRVEERPRESPCGTGRQEGDQCDHPSRVMAHAQLPCSTLYGEGWAVPTSMWLRAVE